MMLIPWRLIGLGAVAAVLTFSHTYVYYAGKSAVYDELAEDRMEVIKDGQAIDKEVLSADDSALCTLLGGCSLPDLGN